MIKAKNYKGIIIFWCIGVVSVVELLFSRVNGLNGLVFKGLGLVMAYFMFMVTVVYGLNLMKYRRYKKGNRANNKSNIENKAKSEFNDKYFTDVKPIYLETVELFKYGIQNKCLSRKDILEIKNELNKVINGYENFKPKNDAHEIYAKLKDKSISKSQMESLRDLIKYKVVSLN